MFSFFFFFWFCIEISVNKQVDPDQKPRYVASEQSLHCLCNIPKGVSGLKRVKKRPFGSDENSDMTIIYSLKCLDTLSQEAIHIFSFFFWGEVNS